MAEADGASEMAAEYARSRVAGADPAPVRMAPRIALFIAPALVAALISAGVGYTTVRLGGVSRNTAHWIGLRAFILWPGGGDGLFYGLRALYARSAAASWARDALDDLKGLAT